ncbi:MAG: DEAD/DEAH box helicase [Proteobacteria bacterium]|nr:DEAD/DEAH box helicase [Pseudomonadota bacterium]
MLGHQSGIIGLPLRLLAREVYDKIVARVGPSAVALVTGEEKIKPDNPRYWVSTVEAMPRGVDADFLAVDEIQLAADPDRGHVFTDRLLHARGRSETLLLGAGTMREAISELIPEANFISRPRLSKITYAGQKKITRMPKRTAIVAFSAAEVYSIAELIRRQLGGAAVVLGALSPRTRNAQVALYQNGDVDYLVATDAIGMGLNLDVDHVAFASVRKFDGLVMRNLSPAELGQIAGRAGRHMNDGTFGVTADVEPLDADLIERLETHTFDTVRVLQWRNRALEFSSLERLRESLRAAPTEPKLQKARMADDVIALEALSNDQAVLSKATNPAAVEKLWDVCQVPDYRKISSQNHAELVAGLYGFLMSPDGIIPEDWFAMQVGLADRTDGDIDTLATRIAHIRTWTFVANRPDWLKDPVHWQERTRAIEDSLSDALHEQLTQRFVDLKTSALRKGLRDKEDMTAEIGADGAVNVENHYVGRLKGFLFRPDAEADATGIHGKTARSATAHVLSKELAMRARRVASAKTDAFKIGRNGRILWRDEEIARLEAGDDPMKPNVVVLADEHLSGPDKEKVQQRLNQWVTEVVGERLKPLVELKSAEDVTGLARGIAFRLTEGFGIVKRDAIAEEMKQLDQPSRAQLRKYGVRFGAFNIFLPPLLKPAASELRLALWTLARGGQPGAAGEDLPEPPRAGLTSVAIDPKAPEEFYRAAGYHVCGPRAIRVDMLERLADTIRPLLAWRASEPSQTPPRGSSGDGAFMVTPEMMSILGCSSAELGSVLSTLGFRSEMRPAPQKKPKVANGADTVDAATAALALAVAIASGSVAAGVATATEDLAAQPTTPAEASAPTDGEAVVAAPSDAPPAAQSETASDGEAKPDVPMIEVWRPRRRHQERRPDRHDGRGRPQRGGGEARANGERSSADDRPRQQGSGQRHGDRNRDRDRNRNRDRDRNRPSGEARPEGAKAEHRRDGAPSEQSRGHADRQRRDDRGQGERRSFGGRGDDRRRDDRRQPQVRSASPQRKGGVDPDSPFAALSALKQQLEKNSKTLNS